MNYNEFNFDGLTRERELSMSAAFPALMRKVYVWMTLALVLTGVTAYGVATSPGILTALYSNRVLLWGLVIAEFAIVFGVSAAINRLSLTTATLLFVLYSVINGALFSSIFMVYTMSSIASVFILYHCWYICGNGTHRLYNQDRSFVDGKDSLHGADRYYYRYCCEYLPEEFWS